MAVAVLLASAARAEDQWHFAPRTPDGPAALFLDWTYSVVLVRIHCDRAAGELVFTALDDEMSEPPKSLGLILDQGRSFDMPALRWTNSNGPNPTTTLPASDVGRLKLTPGIVRAILKARYFDIDAPNDIGEAWSVGRAEALRRLVRICPVR